MQKCRQTDADCDADTYKHRKTEMKADRLRHMQKGMTSGWVAFRHKDRQT